MLEVLLGIVALLFVFFLPGLMVTLTMFPKRGALDRDFDILFKCVLAVVLSIAISIGIGIILNEIGDLVQEPLIRPGELWVALGSFILLFGFTAWLRGGIRSFVIDITGRTDAGLEETLTQLVERKRELQAKLNVLEGKGYQKDEALKQEAEVRIPPMKKEIDVINEKITALLEKELEEDSPETEGKADEKTE